MLSRRLMERFTKDCKIPIKTYKDTNCFLDRLVLYDKFYGTLDKWKEFKDIVSRYPNEEAYFAEYNRVKDNAINFIKDTEGYAVFNTLDMNGFAIKNKQFPNKDIFHPSNIKRTFISIDMKKANFNSLRYYDSSIFDEAETWEDFLRKFTDNEYIVKSKYIREVILGNCNPKRHITYEKYLMDGILTAILEKRTENCIEMRDDDIVFFSNDEIIIDITDMSNDTIRNVEAIVNDVVAHSELPFTIEKFILRGIFDNETPVGYIKELSDGSIDFKCVNSITLPFIIRTINNEPITESDRCFEYEGKLATLIEIPQIKIT